MKQDIKDQNRILWDADARRRLSLKHLKYLSGGTIFISILNILIHINSIRKDENNFMAPFLCIAITIGFLPSALYAIAQLNRIAKVEQMKEKE